MTGLLPVHMRVQPGDSPVVAGLKERLAATYGRISANVRADQELQRERRLALDWCRKNGNPHLSDTPR